ncbi:bifunctional DNA primase/polymerase [Terrabacter sp. 2RAF25]|uniref:bifunctional DNA primase/polymerase n=1 Tax=Terrabacter sp. 2RAF25 TaxID=3232998 RepID=UPI003F9565D8
MGLLTAAQALAANGWEVMPLQGKAPLTRHGCHDASSCHLQIEKWWRRWPSANIGGAVPRSLIVLDIDPRNGGDRGWDELVEGRPVPATLTTLSGRGDGGRHLYFHRPAGQLSRYGLPPGIDLKTNGHCVLPPSVHPVTGRPYAWQNGPIATLPSWLREVLRPLVPSRPAPRVIPSSGSARHLVDFVASQAPGNRNAALYWASRRALDLGVLEQTVEDFVNAAVRAGEAEVAARRTVASAQKARSA